MITNLMVLLLLLSVIIWACVCFETVKSSEKINWKKLNTLLSLGALMTITLLVLQLKGYLF